MSLDISLSKIILTEVANVNITHNLSEMAEEVGLYKILWRAKENGITTAHQLIEPLTAGIARLKADPERFKAFNPKNGWGTYEGFVSRLEKLLLNCQEHPDAEISIWG